MTLSVAETKSPWASTVNWAAVTQMILAAANMIHAPITEGNINTMISAAMFLTGLYTWIRHTWFEPKVLSSSVS